MLTLLKTAFGRKKYNGISKVGRDGTGRRIDIMYTTPQNIRLLSTLPVQKVFNQTIEVLQMIWFTLNEYNLEKLATMMIRLLLIQMEKR